MKEFVSAIEESEKDLLTEDYVEFKLDGRVLRSYTPTVGQLTFMTAGLGSGQTDNKRFAAIINLIMETLSPEDQDYLQGRLLTRNPKEILPPSQLEAIFEYLLSEWFANPTEEQSDSAGSQ